jgi:hypothetical protein
MNLNQLNDKLIAAARADRPSDRVPYAFEKRIMALIAGRPVPDALALWSQALWRAAAAALGVVLLVTVSSLFLTTESTAENNLATVAPATTDLAQDFEKTLLASVDTSANSFEDAQ